MILEKQVEVIGVLRTNCAYILDDGRIGIMYGEKPYQLIFNKPQMSIHDKINFLLDVYEETNEETPDKDIEDIIKSNSLDCIELPLEEIELFKEYMMILL